MLHKFYIQFIALIAVFFYGVNVNAQTYSLIPSSGQKVYVPITAKSVKGKITVSNTVELLFVTLTTHFLSMARC